MKKVLALLSVLTVLTLTTGAATVEEAKIEKNAAAVTTKKVMSDPTTIIRP